MNDKFWMKLGRGSRLRSASGGQAGKQLVPSKSREEFPRVGIRQLAELKTERLSGSELLYSDERRFIPELKSRPLRPHPLFKAFMKAASSRKAGK